MIGNELLGAVANQGRLSGTAASVNHTLLNGGNRIVWASFAAWRNPYPSLSTVTYGGVAMTYLADIVADKLSDYDMRHYVYYILEEDLPANGVNACAGVWSNSAGHSLQVWCTENSAQEVPVAQTEDEYSGATQINNLDVNITAIADDSILGAAAWDESATGTVDASQTQYLASGGTDPVSFCWYEHEVSGGADNHGYTTSATVSLLTIIIWTVRPDPAINSIILMLGANF